MNTRINYSLCLVIGISLVACDWNNQPPRYQLIAAQSDVYRMEVSSGRLTKVEPGGLKPVPEMPTPLVVGDLYKLETGETMKYAGQGKFSPAVIVRNW